MIVTANNYVESADRLRDLHMIAMQRFFTLDETRELIELKKAIALFEPTRCVSKPPAKYATPTDEQRNSPGFEAVWQLIKSWDIAVPEWYDGYTGAMGNHVQAILNALEASKSNETAND